MKFEMWLNNYCRIVDERFFGIEPSIAEQMKLMNVGDTIYIAGHYPFQIIRKQ